MDSFDENPSLTAYLYERGEGRTKHRWKKDRAGFKPAKRGPIGKCHRSISEEIAQNLLHTGIIEPDPFGDDNLCAAPERVYNVYRGIPYVAVPTRPGISYHGYPWRGRMNPQIQEQLRVRAEQSGDLREFQKWLKKYRDK